MCFGLSTKNVSGGGGEIRNNKIKTNFSRIDVWKLVWSFQTY